MIKSLKPPKSGNQLRFLIDQVPSGRTLNALSIPRRTNALTRSGLIRSFRLKASAITFAFQDGNESHNRNIQRLYNLQKIFDESLIVADESYELAYFCGCGRRCSILNCFNLGGVNVNSLTVNHVPEKLNDTNPEITFGELGI
ncbi:hypothetical protein Tco_1572939 [Tanacetum coccineum]